MKSGGVHVIVMSLLAVILSLPLSTLRAEEQATRVQVAGLNEAVEILTDRWGISHIYARNQDDLFFAQGYNAARDRLFQLEIWRRRVTGTLAEIQGPKALDRDIGARLLRPRGDLRLDMYHYHPQGEQIITAFVNGINAYIAQTRQQPELLPVEFQLLGIQPQAWTPDIVVSRLGGIFLNLQIELRLARVLPDLGPDTARELLNLHPGRPDLSVAEGLDLAAIPADVDKYYTAARQRVEFAPEDIVDPAARATPADQGEPAAPTEQPAQTDSEGSNNWVVAGSHTLSRQPFMVNDPHRAITAPSLRYWVHLVAPGWNVIGGGEPHLPGVSIGHNEYGAWGLTIFPTDTEDLYVYETNPDNPNQYRYLGEWQNMRVYTETIPVKGQEPVRVELRYTRHGPVLKTDPDTRRAYALRAAWREIGGAPYLSSLRMDQAKNWEEFREACSYSRAPSENMVWADLEGNIGWQAVGIVPLRPNWSGLLPVPGDGRFEWDGYLPIEQLPHVFNPPQGFWATANQENLPADYPYPISYFWIEPYRFARAQEVLASGRQFTTMDMMRLQNDELSIPARTLVPLLSGLHSDQPPVQQALETLRGWDSVLAKDSVAAGIYAAWQERLWKNFLDRSVPPALHEHFPDIALQPVLNSLLAPDERYGDDPTAGRDQFVLTSLEQAVQSLTERFGPEPQAWTYGQAEYHHILMPHPLGKAVNPAYAERLEVGPIARGGDNFTLNNTDNSAAQETGASFRIIADLSDWDRSLGVNAPGQSGNPDDPHYRDLVPLWQAGKYFPVLYSRDKIEAVSQRKTVLHP
ncbi:MAG: penicillin acylase family protein [Desulfurellaceae bacterium]|nr:penicillin acylase family protein [Desulfurellaceae bacterium]